MGLNVKSRSSGGGFGASSSSSSPGSSSPMRTICLALIAMLIAGAVILAAVSIWMQAKSSMELSQNATDIDIGSWSNWETWGLCSKTCGGGFQSRLRSCSNEECSGYSEMRRSCALNTCDGNGVNSADDDGSRVAIWTTWSNWGKCSGTCGNATQTKFRNCVGGRASNANWAWPCVGSRLLLRPCVPAVPACPVDGGWSGWGGWALCSASCGGGTQARTRTCDQPAPINNGKPCSGSDTDTVPCNAFTCPIIVYRFS